MTYIFGEKSKYAKKSIEQVALADYLGLMDLLKNKSSEEDLKKNILDISEKLNNFIPISQCKACGKDSEYFPMYLTRRQFENPYNGKVSMIPDEVCRDLNDLRCGEHSKNPLQRGLNYFPIRFDILESYSREPKWVLGKINEILLTLSGFSGSKTQKNCEYFFENLKLRPAIVKPQGIVEIIKHKDSKPYQQPELF